MNASIVAPEQMGLPGHYPFSISWLASNGNSRMAIFNWKINSLKKGRATAHSDYVWRRNQFSDRDDLVATGFGNLPAWCEGDPGQLFRGADLYERSNGSACRELVVALPRELDISDWIQLIETLIEQDIGRKPYQYAIHLPNTTRGEEYPHAHILYSDRVPDEHDRPPETFFRRFNAAKPELGGCRKDSGGKSPVEVRMTVIGRKELWATIQNQVLAAGGHSARVYARP
jgi:hypothetical protein